MVNLISLLAQHWTGIQRQLDELKAKMKRGELTEAEFDLYGDLKVQLALAQREENKKKKALSSESVMFLPPSEKLLPIAAFSMHMTK